MQTVIRVVLKWFSIGLTGLIGLAVSTTAMAQYMTEAELLASIKVLEKEHQANQLKPLSTQTLLEQRKRKRLPIEKYAVIFKVLLDSDALGALATPEMLSGFSIEVAEAARSQDVNRAQQYLSTQIKEHEFIVESIEETSEGLRMSIRGKEVLENALNQTDLVINVVDDGVIAYIPRVIYPQEPDGLQPYEPEKWTKESGYQAVLQQFAQSDEEYLAVSIVFRDPRDPEKRTGRQPYYPVIEFIEAQLGQKQLIRYGQTNNERIYRRTEWLNRELLDYVYQNPLVSNIVPR